MEAGSWPSLAINVGEGQIPPLIFPSSSCRLLLLLLRLASMAPIRRFSAAEKGKAPREGPDPLPPKKRLRLPHDASMGREVTRPWQSRPPPGFPLPLYACTQDEDVRHRAAPGNGEWAAITLPTAPWTHAEGRSREFVVWAVMTPDTWIRLPRFFTSELHPRGPVELWL